MTQPNSPEPPPAPHPQQLPGTQNALAKVIAWALQRSLVRAILRYIEHRGPMLADSITYRALFSVFAAVLLSFSIAALWLGGNPEVLVRLAESLDGFVPGLSEVLDVTQIEAPVGFSVVGALSVIGLVVAALGAIGSLRGAFRVLSDGIGDEPMVVWAQLRNALVGVLFVGLLVTAIAATWITNSGIAVLAGWLRVTPDSQLLQLGANLGGLLIALGVNTLAMVVAFRLLSGIAAPKRALWIGALTGGVGLLVLQEFSALFVRGATANPLFASFAVLVALLLWMNLSSQVLLISASLIVTLTAEAHDRVHERYGASTMVQRRRLRAEQLSEAAQHELREARAAERKERESVMGVHGSESGA